MKTMSFRGKVFSAFFGLIAIFLTAGAAAAQSDRNKSDQDKSAEFADITIKNFGKMDDRFYRGAQPKEGDYTVLAAHGVKTIIDLRDTPTTYEQRLAEAAGMRYVNIPMSDTVRPTDEQISQFLKLANDPETGRFFVHCAGGRHRTGAVGAVYRFTHDGWTFDQAYKEMKDYDYYSRWGHGAIKKFVRDYFDAMQSHATTTVSAR
jgi:protein tyrosine/serine phosphatase